MLRLIAIDIVSRLDDLGKKARRLQSPLLTIVFIATLFQSFDKATAKIPFVQLKETSFFDSKTAYLNPIFGVLTAESKMIEKLLEYPIDDHRELKEAKKLASKLFYSGRERALKPRGINKPSFYFSPRFIGRLCGLLSQGTEGDHSIDKLEMAFINDSEIQKKLQKSRAIAFSEHSTDQVQIGIFKRHPPSLGGEDSIRITWQDLKPGFKKELRTIFRLAFNPRQNQFLTLRILQAQLWLCSYSKEAFSSYYQGLISAGVEEGIIELKRTQSISWGESSWTAEEIMQSRHQLPENACKQEFALVVAGFLSMRSAPAVMVPLGFINSHNSNWADCAETSIRNFLALLTVRPQDQYEPSFSLDRLVGLNVDMRIVDYFTEFHDIALGQTPEARELFADICSSIPGVDYVNADHRFEISSRRGADNILDTLSALLKRASEPKFNSWEDLEAHIQAVISDFSILDNQIDMKTGYGTLKFSVDGRTYAWMMENKHFSIVNVAEEVRGYRDIRSVLGSALFAKYPDHLEENHLNMSFFDCGMLGSMLANDANEFFLGRAIDERRNFIFLLAESADDIREIIDAIPHHENRHLDYWAQKAKEHPQLLDTAIARVVSLPTSEDPVYAEAAYERAAILASRCTRLCLIGQNINRAGISMIAKILSANTSIETLILSNNNIGDTELRILIEGSRQNHSLRFLNLSANMITWRGIAHLQSLGTQVGKALEVINIYGNPGTAKQEPGGFIRLPGLTKNKTDQI